ncbi:MAG: UvrD-helicase domain-containing protein [Roseibacillus sp.]
MKSALHNELILASAGSGKTWQLTNRYIAIMGQALIAGDEVQPERIVAVTFTRKAAGEFFESILHKLANAARDPAEARKLASDPDDPLHPIFSELKQEDYVQLLAIFLRRMPALFLGTLDSFFSAILRSFPAEFGLSSQFDILDDHAAHLARHDVYREVFHTRQDQHRQDFLEAFKRATFGQEEARVVNQLDRFVSKHHEIFMHAANPELWGNPAAIWPNGSPWIGVQGNLAQDFERLFEVFAADQITDKQWDYWHDFRDQALLHSPGNSLPLRVRFFLGKFLNEENWRTIQAGEATFTVNRRSQTLNEEACEIIFRITTRLVSAEIEVHLKRTQGIWHVLNQYESSYASLVRRRGRLTFSDLEIILSGCDLHSQSAPVLSQKPDAFDRLRIDYRLDGRYDHWLLDEFQDTSYLQWSIIEPLVDEAVQDVSQQRSLFQVGDVKQAIYAWRGGDTRLFHDIFERYRGSDDDPRALRPRPLNVSWRSGHDVIHLVNRIFGETSALDSLGMPREAISRWKWQRHEVAPPNDEMPGYAAFYQPAPTGGEEATSEDCFAVALELLEKIQPISRGLSCAILVQDNRTGHAILDYVRANTRSGIPVAGDANISPALDNSVTLALLSLLRVASHPADRFAWQHLAFSPLAAILPEGPGALSHDVLESLHRHGYERTLRDWSARLESADIELDSFGTHRLDELALAARMFDQGGNRSPDDFLRFAEDYTVREVTTNSAVQVMTIHKAKGLTFDVVILPDLGGDSLTNPRKDIGVQRERETRNVEWVFDIPRRIIADADPVLQRYRQGQEAEAGYEELCKFYVALTRARHANYLIALPLNPRSRARNFIKLLHETIVLGSPPTVSLGEADALALYESTQSTADAQWYLQAEREPIGKTEESAASPDPIDLKARIRPRRRIPSAHGAGTLPGSGLFSREINRARNHGTMVHALFEEIEWLDDFDLKKDASRWEVQRHRAPQVFEDARKEVKRSLADATVQAALSKPRISRKETVECWRERPFELLRNGDWISGIFDRVVIVHGPGRIPLRATILDFKTDRVASEREAEQQADHYRPQLLNYRDSISQLIGLPNDRIKATILFSKLPLVLEVTL